jgi:hypothetical protein
MSHHILSNTHKDVKFKMSTQHQTAWCKVTKNSEWHFPVDFRERKREKSQFDNTLIVQYKHKVTSQNSLQWLERAPCRSDSSLSIRYHFPKCSYEIISQDHNQNWCYLEWISFTPPDTYNYSAFNKNKCLKTVPLLINLEKGHTFCSTEAHLQTTKTCYKMLATIKYSFMQIITFPT